VFIGGPNDYPSCCTIADNNPRIFAVALCSTNRRFLGFFCASSKLAEVFKITRFQAVGNVFNRQQ
jgi:hypothetical protein